MFSVTVCFGPQGTVWAFLFKDEEKAKIATTPVDSEQIVIRDDFGQCGVFKLAGIHGMLLEDMNLSRLAHQERTLFVERIKAAVTQAVQVDPAMRAIRTGGGPAIVTPFGQPR